MEHTDSVTHPATERCFLLTTDFRDFDRHCEIDLFARTETGTPIQIAITNFKPPFFVLQTVPSTAIGTAVERRPLSMVSFDNQPVDSLYFSTLRDLRQCAAALRSARHPVFESDIHPLDRFLMERSVFGGFEATGVVQHTPFGKKMVNPHLRGASVNVTMSILSLDIETNAATGEIYSIASAGEVDRVFVHGKGTFDAPVTTCKNEREVLEQWLQHIRNADPDILIGWNIVEFDLRCLYDRCMHHRLPFLLGRSARPDRVFTPRNSAHTVVRIAGRAVIDVPMQLRTFHGGLEEYSLNNVASVLLNKQKDITATGRDKIAEINRRFSEDTRGLALYNLDDALLTREIFDTAGILPDATERTRLSGHLLDRTGGSIAAFDYLYLPRLHRAGFVAPDAIDAELSDDPLPGGYVIEPSSGLYDNVLVFDFRSLYPSIIMSFLIDPLGLRNISGTRVKNPYGSSFSREPALLPAIISELLSARIEAKQKKNNPLSQAIKILMNSFYGVLGARNCRFFSAELATTITRTGQYILKKSIAYIERTFGHPVIYGDTDSLFVCLGNGTPETVETTGKEIAAAVTSFLRDDLNSEFAIESALLLQYERHFRYFLIPSVRGATQGSKKHYCGGHLENGTLTLHFKGMESARSDWTDLAKDFQHELVHRLFCKEPLEPYIHATVTAVENGELDNKLVYRKRLRKQIDEYTQSVPPHAQAAKLLDYTPSIIRYCITTNGPQPVERLSAPLDYRHYIECQLQPVADTILELVGSSFDRILSGQQELFS